MYIHTYTFCWKYWCEDSAYCVLLWGQCLLCTAVRTVLTVYCCEDSAYCVLLWGQCLLCTAVRTVLTVYCCEDSAYCVLLWGQCLLCTAGKRQCSITRVFITLRTNITCMHSFTFTDSAYCVRVCSPSDPLEVQTYTRPLCPAPGDEQLCAWAVSRGRCVWAVCECDNTEQVYCICEHRH